MYLNAPASMLFDAFISLPHHLSDKTDTQHPLSEEYNPMNLLLKSVEHAHGLRILELGFGP